MTIKYDTPVALNLNYKYSKLKLKNTRKLIDDFLDVLKKLGELKFLI